MAEAPNETPEGPGKRVVLEFPTPEDATRFLGWLCNGGGEYAFFDAEDMNSWMIAGGPIVRMNYDRAFPEWGYDPETHGPDRVVVCERDDSDTSKE